MASVETTTIRVRRSTHERLQKEAELAGKSVTQLLEEAADLLEEVRILEGAERAFERRAALSPADLARDRARDDEWVREIESLPPFSGRD